MTICNFYKMLKLIAYAVLGIVLMLSPFYGMFPAWMPLTIFKLDYSYLGIPAGQILEVTWKAIVAPIGGFIDKHAETIFSWPVAFIFVSYVAIRSPLIKWIVPSAAARVKSLDIFGAKLELTDQIQELKKESDDLSKLLPNVRESVSEELRNTIKEIEINRTFAAAVKEVSKILLSEKKDYVSEKVRATIHIEDPLFSDQLMQLLEYVTGSGEVIPGRAAGRVFSIRRGIVGRVWRSEIPEISGVIPTDLQTSHPSDNIKHIAQIWGLTQDEAKHVASYPSYIAIPFQYAARRAVFYMDSTDEHAFMPHGRKEHLIPKITNVPIEKRLGGIVASIAGVMARRGPQIGKLESFSAE